MLNPHIKGSFWEIHLSNCGWLEILQRLSGGKRALGCKWVGPRLFCCRWENRLRRRIRNQGSLISFCIPRLCSPSLGSPLLTLFSRPQYPSSLYSPYPISPSLLTCFEFAWADRCQSVGRTGSLGVRAVRCLDTVTFWPATQSSLVRSAASQS